MTLRARLAVGLIAIAAILVAPLVIALRALGALHSSTERLQAEAVAGSMELRRVQSIVDDARLAEDALLFVHDRRSLARMLGAARSLQLAADSLRAYRLEAQADALREGAQGLGEGAQIVYDLATAGRGVEAERAADERVRLAIARLDVAVHDAERALESRTHETVLRASESASAANRLAALALALALAAGGAIAIFLTRSISRPVIELERGMHNVAEGEFDYELALEATRQDEFGRLAASFRAMSRQLSKLDRMKSEFVSIATHELKTPINVIIGYVQLLEDGLYGPLEARQAEACRTVQRQARSLDRLVRRLLDVSRFEAGVVTLDINPVHLRSLLEDVRTDFSVLGEQRGVTLEMLIGEGAPETVEWDEDRVGEMLGNLVSNAINFTEAGGKITFAAFPHENDSVRLSVKDTGVGISSDQLPRVFEKFYQARNQATARAKGTGLGLAIVKEIVEAHGGTISAESAVGRGTEFTIIMPARATVSDVAPTVQPRREEALA